MMDIDYKAVLGGVAVVMTVMAHLPYLRTTLRGSNKPHIFTWIIWTLLTGIGYAGQVAGNGGAGAWATGVTCIICVVILLAALRQGEKNVTWSDWAMFLAGLCALPLWWLTRDPLWSVILVSAIDASAFYPTFRKSWHRPHEEHRFMYGFSVPRHVIALLALRTVSVTTALYPLTLLVMNLIMYVMLKTRQEKTGAC